MAYNHHTNKRLFSLTYKHNSIPKGYGELPTRPDSPTAQRAKNMSKSSASKNQAAQEQANEIANCASESGRSGGSASRGVGAVDVDGTRTEYVNV